VTATGKGRTVIGNIALSLDGRVAGQGGEYDMSWIVPHAVTAGARSHMLRVTRDATTALLGRKNYQGFAGYWPSVAEDESAHPDDRAFARWLNAVEKVVFSRTVADAVWDNTRVVSADPATAEARCTAGWPGSAVATTVSAPVASAPTISVASTTNTRTYREKKPARKRYRR